MARKTNYSYEKRQKELAKKKKKEEKRLRKQQDKLAAEGNGTPETDEEGVAVEEDPVAEEGTAE
jgi:hypothetical protein